MPFTSSREIDGWLKSYREEASADPEYFSEHPVDVNLFFDLQDEIEKIVREDEEKERQREEELAKQQEAEATAEEHEDTTEEAPVESSNSQEDVAQPAEESTDSAEPEPAAETPANDATSSSKPEDNQLSPTDANAQGSQASPSTEEPGRGATIDPNNTMTKGTAYPVIKINDTYISQHEIVEFYVETGYFRNPMEYQTEKLLKTGFVPTMHLVV